MHLEVVALATVTEEELAGKEAAATMVVVVMMVEVARMDRVVSAAAVKMVAMAGAVMDCSQHP